LRLASEASLRCSTENLKIAFAITYIAIVWICLEAVRIPELRDLIKQGYQTTMRITCLAHAPFGGAGMPGAVRLFQGPIPLRYQQTSN
jgi:hypothetical protein